MIESITSIRSSLSTPGNFVINSHLMSSTKPYHFIGKDSGRDFIRFVVQADVPVSKDLLGSLIGIQTLEILQEFCMTNLRRDPSV